MPFGLIKAVPVPLRENAAVLLGEADVIKLADEQAREFSAGTDVTAVLQSLLDEREKQLQFFIARPIDEKQFHKSHLQQVKEGREYDLRKLRSEINQLLAWKDELKPYLIKAVALWERTGGFVGSITPQAVVIGHTSLGDRPAPMANVPVVAFLPHKPSKVYTLVAMAK